ncbi:hypothetical protein RUM44_001183 [Polyplax serrata]|uniref:Transmembrane protein 5 n=1 Tax=Polyplax serrata TaxID=468196 RepID=A0ABR1B9T4_POLSC
MKRTSKFIVKLTVVCLVISLTYMIHNAFSSMRDSLEDAQIMATRSEKVTVLKAYMGAAENLFKNVDNSFEDMYNFKVDFRHLKKNKSKKFIYPKHEVEIWGKASIGEYLWSHILDGNSTTYANGLIKHGETKIKNLHFRYRSGPGIVQNTVPTSVKNLVLVLNGKDDVKIKFSKTWLEYLVHFKNLKNVAVVLLGDEKCDNNWILQHLKTRGGVVDIVFVTYDSKLVDNKEIYQWPLGVATYRGFPVLGAHHVNLDVARQHLCSFMGTVYRNTSREVLNNILKRSSKCFVASRETWVPVETFESMSRYIKQMTDSDITLNPVGQNTECYRIYEALSLGTVPVVEDVATSKDCDVENSQTPLRLLKEYNAPLIYVKNWTDLNRILDTEEKLSLEKKIERRKKVFNWYEEFKVKMKNRFVQVIKKNFFKEE